MAFSKITGKSIDVSTESIAEFNSTGIDDNATSTAITIAANNSVSIPSLYGNITTADNLTVGGDFIVQGNNFTIDADSLRVEDSLIQLASNNESSDVIDIGFFGHYSNDGNTALHTGFFRDASDEQYYLFNGLEDANLDANNSVTTINRSGTGFTLADLNIGNLSSTGGLVATSNSGDDVELRIQNTSQTSGDTATLRFSVTGNTAFDSAFVGSDRTNSLIFGSNVVERMRINASGNVGIKTTSPSFPLAGQLHISGGTGYVGLNLQKGSAATGHLLEFTDENNTLQYRIGTNFANGGQNLLFAYGSTPTVGMTLDSSGNIGIGGSISTAKLYVVGATNDSTQLAIRAQNLATSDVFFVRNDGSMVAGIGSKMTLDASGKVGIGTTPATNLHILDSNPVVRLQSNGAGTDNTLSFLSRNISNVGAFADIIAEGAGHNSTNAPIVFTQGSGQTERMRIDAGGKLGVGTDSPTTLIEVEQNSTSGTTGSFPEITATNTNAAGVAGFRANGANGAVAFQLIALTDRARISTLTNYPMTFLTNSVERMHISSSGNVGIGAIPDTTHRVTIAGTGGDRTQPLEVLGTGTSNGFSWLISGMQQNLSNGHRAVLFLGKSESTYNSGGMYYYHTGDGSASNQLRWGLFAADDLMALNASGNLGIGAIPVSHYSGYTAIDLGASATIWSNKTTADTNISGLGNNAYYNGTNWTYKNTDEATSYSQANGGHFWYYAASGTAGTAITFNEAARIDTSGRLLVGKNTATFTPVGCIFGPSNVDGNGWSAWISATPNSTGGALALNRNSSDGEQIRFHLNGGKFGDISNNGNNLKINGTSAIEFAENGTTRFYLDSTGIFPWADNTYDIGSTSLRFRNVYTTDLHLSNIGKEEGNKVDGTTGNWTIQEGAENLYIINNLTGKTYKFSLEEV